MKAIQWETNLETALQRAKAEKKPVLLDFFNPGWIGCKQMDAVTYPEEKVTDFISEQTIPLRVSSTDAMADEFNVQWTPTLVVLDAQGKEHSRTIGFLGPAEIAPVLLLGEARAYFNREENEQALTVLGKLLAEFPASDQIPEAIFFQGVALYKHTHEPKHLRVAYDRLTNEHPGHEWTKRAYPYRLIGEWIEALTMVSAWNFSEPHT